MLGKIIANRNTQKAIVQMRKRGFTQLVNWETSQPAPVGSVSDCKS